MYNGCGIMGRAGMVVAASLVQEGQEVTELMPQSYRTINWMLRNIPLSRGIAVKADDWFGYGKPEPELKWWLDLELIDDQLQAVPPSKGK